MKLIFSPRPVKISREVYAKAAYIKDCLHAPLDAHLAANHVIKAYLFNEKCEQGYIQTVMNYNNSLHS